MSRSDDPHKDLLRYDEKSASDDRGQRIEDLRASIRAGTYGEQDKLCNLLEKMLGRQSEKQDEEEA